MLSVTKDKNLNKLKCASVFTQCWRPERGMDLNRSTEQHSSFEPPEQSSKRDPNPAVNLFKHHSQVTAIKSEIEE